MAKNGITLSFSNVIKTRWICEKKIGSVPIIGNFSSCHLKMKDSPSEDDIFAYFLSYENGETKRRMLFKPVTFITSPTKRGRCLENKPQNLISHS